MEKRRPLVVGRGQINILRIRGLIATLLLAGLPLTLNIPLAAAAGEAKIDHSNIWRFPVLYASFTPDSLGRNFSSWVWRVNSGQDVQITSPPICGRRLSQRSLNL